LLPDEPIIAFEKPGIVVCVRSIVALNQITLRLLPLYERATELRPDVVLVPGAGTTVALPSSDLDGDRTQTLRLSQRKSEDRWRLNGCSFKFPTEDLLGVGGSLVRCHSPNI
jgi:hypothetical protein